MDIYEFYERFNRSLGYDFRDGYKFTYGDKDFKQKAGGKERLVILPLYDVRRRGLNDEVHPFHPLCENVIDGQSPTVKFIRASIMREIQANSITLIDKFLEAASGKRSPRSALFNNVKARCTEGIKQPKWDTTLIKSWNKLKEFLFANRVPRMILTMNSDIDGKRFSRVCNYATLLDEESDEPSDMFFDVKLARKQDKTILYRLAKEIFNMFPELTGSNDERPYFGCMARGWREYVTKYNALAHSMHETSVVCPQIQSDWMEEIDNLEQYEGKIESMAFNTGETTKKPKTTQRTISHASQPPLVSNTQQPPQHTAGGERKPTLQEIHAARYNKPAHVATNVNMANLTLAERKRLEANCAQQTYAPAQGVPSAFNTPNVVEAFNAPNTAPSLFSAPAQAPYNPFRAAVQSTNSPFSATTAPAPNSPFSTGTPFSAPANNSVFSTPTTSSVFAAPATTASIFSSPTGNGLSF